MTEELVSTVFNEFLEDFMTDIHTCMPGKVISFDAAAQTIEVQPCLKRLFFGDDEAIEIPIIGDVPVVFPGSGDFWITFDVKPDSYVLLVFAERSIANWMQAGGVIDPEANHKFNFSDAIAIPGMLPTPAALSTIDSDALTIRNVDNDTQIQIKDNQINITTGTGTVQINSAADAAALASKVDSFISTLYTLFTTGWVVPPAPDAGAALKTAFALAFSTPPASTASAKLKVDS